MDALHAAQAKGVIVAVDSGRYAENAYMEVIKNGLQLPVIGTNGTKIIDETGRKLAMYPMNADTADAVRDCLDRIGCRYFMYGDDFLATSDDEMRHHSEIGQGGMIEEMFPFRFVHGKAEMRKLCRDDILKFYICDNGDLDGVKREMEKLSGITITRSSVRNLEISPEGVDKATGLKHFADRFGIDMADIMTFGDQDNDLPMLKAAGWGCAMENGDPEVIAQVKFTAPSNDMDGIAHMVEKYVLND
ncbi:MAG: hypothetical protein CW338_07050 [Clostridiales bacterium]|nr:hypothetical protein [Clostridiales bacterium]